MVTFNGVAKTYSTKFNINFCDEKVYSCALQQFCLYGISLSLYVQLQYYALPYIMCSLPRLLPVLYWEWASLGAIMLVTYTQTANSQFVRDTHMHIVQHARNPHVHLHSLCIHDDTKLSFIFHSQCGVIDPTPVIPSVSSVGPMETPSEQLLLFLAVVYYRQSLIVYTIRLQLSLQITGHINKDDNNIINSAVFNVLSSMERLCLRILQGK